jgi:hypothetical protein
MASLRHYGRSHDAGFLSLSLSTSVSLYGIWWRHTNWMVTQACFLLAGRFVFAVLHVELMHVSASWLLRHQPEGLRPIIFICIFILASPLCCASHKIVIGAIDTTNCIKSSNTILYKYMATCYDQLCGHPQPIRTHKIIHNKICTCNSDFMGSNGLKIIM